jgi:hypothetical protein
LRVRARPLASLAAALAWITVAAVVLIVTSPWLSDLTTFGFHDWDVATSQRYLVKLSLLRYGEMPFWNPYACGGFPAWGYIEGGTTLVSPWLLHYLALPLSVALRVEVIGMGLLGALGAYAFTGRFTRSFAARALVVALWAVNGRWALQAAAGHTWHLAYAWMPWCFYFFERARERPLRFPYVFGLAACLAMLVYAGGVYPLPHTVLALVLYASALAILERSWLPVVRLAQAGILGFGLCAPKLLPMLVTFRRTPRFVDSVEKVDLGGLVTLLTSRDQKFHARPVVLPHGWHENGMYISAVGLVVLVAAVLLVWSRREVALKMVGLILVALGLGAFHPLAPWALLHAHAPFFRSQHVPIRFLYPALLLLAVVAAAGVGRIVSRRPWLDAAAALAVLVLAIDISSVARQPMTESMWMVAPSIPEGDPFHFEQEPPFQYVRKDWAGPMYLAMLGNRGVINCYGVPPFGERGARALTDPHYRGEAYVEAADGSAVDVPARVVTWSPNRAVVELDAAVGDGFIVYNMNYDPGWESDAGPVVSRDDKVAVRIDGAKTRVTFRYRPPGLWVGLFLGGLSAAFCLFPFGRLRRARPGRTA